jgi:hypothetical protein
MCLVVSEFCICPFLFMLMLFVSMKAGLFGFLVLVENFSSLCWRTFWVTTMRHVTVFHSTQHYSRQLNWLVTCLVITWISLMLQKLITMMMTVAVMTVYLLTLLVLSSVWNSLVWPAVCHTEGDYGSDMLQFSFTLYVWSFMFYHIQLDSNTIILP